MKKSITLILAIISSSFFVLKSQIISGIDLGLNISSIQLETDNMLLANDKATLTPRTGIRIGLNGLYKINNHFSLESGIYYSNKGQNRKNAAHFTPNPANNDPIESQIDAYDINDYFKLNYIHIPITFNVNFSKVYLSCGIYGAIGIASTFQTKSFFYKSDSLLYSTVEEQTIWTDKRSSYRSNYRVSGSFKQFDYGLSFGIGYRLKRFAIKSVYEIGIPHILKQNYQDFFYSSSENKYKNRVLTFSVCYYWLYK